MSSKPSLFTPRSARAAAHSLRPTLHEALLLYRALTPRAPGAGCSERPVDPTYFAGVRRLLKAVDRIREAGADLDLPRARLRFPARRQGSDVVLCWDLAEPHALWQGDAPAVEDGAWEEAG